MVCCLRIYFSTELGEIVVNPGYKAVSLYYQDFKDPFFFFFLDIHIDSTSRLVKRPARRSI